MAKRKNSKKNPMVHWTAYPPDFIRPYYPKYLVEGYNGVRGNPGFPKALARHLMAAPDYASFSSIGREAGLSREAVKLLWQERKKRARKNPDDRPWDWMRDVYSLAIFPYGTKSTNNGNWYEKYTGVAKYNGKEANWIGSRTTKYGTWSKGFARKSDAVKWAGDDEVFRGTLRVDTEGRNVFVGEEVFEQWGDLDDRGTYPLSPAERTSLAKANTRRGKGPWAAKVAAERRAERGADDSYGRGFYLIKAKKSARWRVEQLYRQGRITKAQRDKANRSIDRASTLEAKVLQRLASPALYEEIASLR